MALEVKSEVLFLATEKKSACSVFSSYILSSSISLMVPLSPKSGASLDLAFKFRVTQSVPGKKWL